MSKNNLKVFFTIKPGQTLLKMVLDFVTLVRIYQEPAVLFCSKHEKKVP
jgi:hypothetical protein